jgi:hypothetical protein
VLQAVVKTFTIDNNHGQSMTLSPAFVDRVNLAPRSWWWAWPCGF